MYPANLKSPYRERRFAAGEQRYAALGIERHDSRARERHVAGNWNCFGAPAALFCYIDRDMEPAQWADVGMYLQTVSSRIPGRPAPGSIGLRSRRRSPSSTAACPISGQPCRQTTKARLISLDFAL